MRLQWHKKILHFKKFICKAIDSTMKDVCLHPKYFVTTAEQNTFRSIPQQKQISYSD